MQISQNLEERLVRLLQTRPLDTLMDSHGIQSISDSLFKLKQLDKAAVFEESSRLRTEITTLQQSAKNSGSALTMLNIAQKAMQNQLSAIDNIDLISQKFKKNSLSDLEQDAYLNFVTKDLLAVDYIASQTQYNYIKLLDGTFQNKTLSVSPNDKDIKISFTSTNIDDLGNITYTTSANITHDEAFEIKIADETFVTEQLKLDGSYGLNNIANKINNSANDDLEAKYKIISFIQQ